MIELEQSTPLSLASRKRSKEQSEEDLAYFEKTDRTHREKAAKQNLKRSTDYLSYAKEELEQLQKMYAADDLTEETEEIILTRAKNSVASAQFRMGIDETLNCSHLEKPPCRENTKVLVTGSNPLRFHGINRPNPCRNHSRKNTSKSRK